nr:hypothetical protein [Chitinophagaceae bacterium]
SFCVFLILNLFELRFKNKELFDMEKEMKLHNIDGSITSNCFEQDKMWIVSYLNKNQYYTIDNNEIKIEELKNEMKRYKVNYFIDFSQKSIFVKNHFLDPNFEFVFQSTSGASFFKFKN